MNESKISLATILNEAGLLRYEQQMRTFLKLREASDVIYVDEKDFNAIGMSRSEQKRLKAAYNRMYPRNTVMGKLKKKLLRIPNDPKKVEVPERDEDQHVIPLERIELGKELGKGEFGSVFQAVWTNSSGERIQVAVKCVNTLKMLSNSSNFIQEAAIMHKLKHEYVVRLYGVVLDTKTVMLVSELATCGSLLECLQNPSLRSTFFIDTLCDFCTQIASGMKYLAAKRLIHRDLAARNILVFALNKVKIADFGLSRLLGAGEYYYRGASNEGMKLPIAWCAPESINFLRFTSASDVWSFGVTLYELFSYGKTPWAGLSGSQILSAVDYPRSERLPCPEFCPVDYYKLMQQCWAYRPEERPTFSNILENLNDISPQSVITVTVCSDGVSDHLQYGKHEIIVVLDKQPSAYPDGYYWMGCTRSGCKGLFRPANTVARLGAENPCKTFSIDGILHSSGCIVSKDKAEKDKDKCDKDKKRKKKVVISEPQNDLRHTCHIGIDGTSFGVIPSADKLSNDPLPSLSSVGTSDICLQLPSGKSVSLPMSTSNSPLAQKLAMMEDGRNSSCSTAITSFTEVDSTSDSVFTDQLLVALPRTKPSLAAPATLSYRNGVKNVLAKHEGDNDPANMITEVLNDMDLIVRDFEAPSSLNDEAIPRSVQDDRSANTTSKEVSVCRVMSEGELEKWEGKVDREHKKASKVLRQERSKELEEWGRLSIQKNGDASTSVDDCSDRKSGRAKERLHRSFSNTLPTKGSDEWSEEAQKAYKLLVECGNNLKYGRVPVSQCEQLQSRSQMESVKKISSATKGLGRRVFPSGVAVEDDSANTSFSEAKVLDSANSHDVSPLRQLCSPKGSSGFKSEKSGHDFSSITPSQHPTADCEHGSNFSDHLHKSVNESSEALKNVQTTEVLLTESGEQKGPLSRKSLPPLPHFQNPPPVPPKPNRKAKQDSRKNLQGSFASAVANSALFATVTNEEVLNF